MALRGNVGGAPPSVVHDKGLERAIEAFKQIRSPVPKEIQRLTSTVNRIKAVLRDAEEKQMDDDAVCDWLRELKQVFLDAEDLVDEYTTDAALPAVGAADRRKQVGTTLAITNTMRGRIGEIHGRLDHLARQKDVLGLQISTVGDSRLECSRRRQTSSLLADETSVIGREGEKEEIIQLLLSSTDVVADPCSNNRSVSVLPIVGMGGVGKTTLARLVFNDEKIKQHFGLTMWVCVSNDFDRVRLTKEMIDAASASSGGYEQCHSTHWDTMQRRLLREVEGKTFLLVVDDVWEADQFKWEELFKPLTFGGKGSKILVTTRNRDVVDKILGRMAPIPLGGLSDGDIWSLFKRYAFHGVTDANGAIYAEHAHLEATGRSFVQRLKGSPLAARTMGSLLNAELEARHWETVVESELWTLPQGEDDILPALALSYRYLDGDLKQCFAYCSLFPKDHTLRRDEIVGLWEAQCFIGIERGIRNTATGSKYFDELMYRSIFELSPSESKQSEVRDFCVMHDLTHDLAEYVSRDDCFRLEDGKSMEILDTVRHISVCLTDRYGRGDLFLDELCRHKRLRTLIFLRRGFFVLRGVGTRALGKLLSNLKLLRGLGLRDCNIEQLPSSIGGLKHLRYLDLSENSRLKRLPESLGNLYNLQVLKLQGCSKLDALPARISELLNLRQLVGDAVVVSGINQLEKLTGLQEIEVRGTKVSALGGMAMLRKLRIWMLEEVGTREQAIQARLDSKERLQVLRLEWSSDRCQDGDYADYYDGRDGTTMNPAAEEQVLRVPMATSKSYTCAVTGESSRRTGWKLRPHVLHFALGASFW